MNPATTHNPELILRFIPDNQVATLLRAPTA
jgi:hypothetical protein